MSSAFTSLSQDFFHFLDCDCPQDCCATAQVLYLDVNQTPGLKQLHIMAKIAAELFEAAGLLDADQEANSAFTPHVTVAKLSQLMKKNKGGKRQRSKSTAKPLKKLPQV